MNGNGDHIVGNGNGEQSRESGFFDRLFNISRREWMRVLFCFALSFLPRIGFVVGWTALTAMFVARYGIAFLPTLFIFDAILIIGGFLLYSRLIRNFKTEHLMIVTVLLASAMLFSATFFPERNFWFFIVVIAAQAVFLSQLTILTSIFVEHQFSPLESQRTFPFIESAETVGSIIGGTIIGYSLIFLEVQQFLLIWILFAFLILPLLVFYNLISPKLPVLPLLVQPQASEPKRSFDIGRFFQGIRKQSFLKGLIVVVIAQWVIFNMLEFQYTKAVEQRIAHREEQTLVHQPKPRAFYVSLLTDPTGLTTSSDFFHSLPRETLGYDQERELAEVLGKLHMLFGVLALIVHLLLASRFIQYLGVIQSMFIHPLLLLGSFVFLFLRYGFISAVMTKANFEVGHALFRNSYHSSFYAFPHGFREEAKEFLEGFIRPFGVIIGMGSLLLFHFLWSGKELTLAIHLAMVLALFFMLQALYRLKGEYTDLSKQTLFSGKDESEVWNAAEILCQKGHDRAEEMLIMATRNFLPRTSYAKILVHACGQSKNPKVVPLLLDCLGDERPEIRSTALKALERIALRNVQASVQAFSRYRMIDVLKNLFAKEHSTDMRARIIRLFSHLHERDAIDFLLQNLSHEDDEIKVHSMVACGRFKDPGIFHYLKPYLEHSLPKVRAGAVSSLWQFPWLREKIQPILEELLAIRDPETLSSIFQIFREMEHHGYSKMLRKSLHHEHDGLRFQAALSLANLGDHYGIEVLVENLLAYDSKKWEKLLENFSFLPSMVKRRLKSLLSRKFSEKISRLVETVPPEEWRTLPASTLHQMEVAYELLGFPKEASLLRSLSS